jgi:signal transduction histidine kinase
MGAILDVRRALRQWGWHGARAAWTAKRPRMIPDPLAADADAAALDHLRRTERIIVGLRWIGMASWLLILLRGHVTVAPALVWTFYAACVFYTYAAHRLAHRASAIRATAVATTAADSVITALACLMTGGLASDFYPYFYLTIPATSMRFGVRETFLVCAINAALSACVYLVVPGTAVPGDLALRVFYLFFSALIGSALSRAVRQNAAQARVERDNARHLLWRSIHAEEEERKRIAGEIHDRMGRQLFELTYGIDRAREHVADPATGATLARLGSDARACSDTIRDLMNELRPPVLDDFGFTEALREYVASLAAHDDLAVALDVDDALRSGRPDVNVTLFRILQEAVANVRKHAGAHRLSIEFRRAEAGRLRLVVRDDGRGFDPGVPARGHFGLRTMRERAEACGGVLAVSSAPGLGTEIAVTVPA